MEYQSINKIDICYKNIFLEENINKELYFFSEQNN